MSSRDAGGDGYESNNETTPRFGIEIVVGGKMDPGGDGNFACLSGRLWGCGTGSSGCVAWLWLWMGGRCDVMDMFRGRPYAVVWSIAVVVVEVVSIGASMSGGVSIPLIILSSAFVLGNIISLAASTLLILFSPLSTSPFALLYIHSPTNVMQIPRPCTGCTFWLNHAMAIHITATRLMRDAIEYVTGDVEERIMNAMMFCAKWTVPFMKK